MIRPASFGYNPETAVNNMFQQQVSEEHRELQEKVLGEFDSFVNMLTEESIEVDVLEDNPDEKRFDAIFANNWFSTHPGQHLVTYPMFSPIRRRERDPLHIRYIIDKYQVFSHLSLENYERENLFLEGTGSLIIDHEYGLVYGNRSPRTDQIPFTRFCQQMGFTPVLFDAVDENDVPVYHTNVVMGIGRGYIIINRSAVAREDWSKLVFYFGQSDKQVIEISHDQMASFLGNTAFIHNEVGKPYIVMSDTAYASMQDAQENMLAQFGTILHSDIGTIETIGGGSAKCMIAENYLNRR